MAGPTELERLRQAIKLQAQCLDSLAAKEALQSERWELLGQVVEDATWQFTTMRIDAVEESLRDQGPPFWLSVILAVGMSFIPMTVVTAKLLAVMTKSSQSILTLWDRRLLEKFQKDVMREAELYKPWPAPSLDRQLKIQGEIWRTEQMLARYADIYEPELHHLLSGAAQGLGKIIGKHLYKQESAQKQQVVSATDVPILVVKRALRQSMEAHRRGEAGVRKRLRRKIHDLFDVAVAEKPAAEAKNKQKEAQKKEGIELELPKTYKKALEELTKIRDGLTRTVWENHRVPQVQDLWEMQLTIESVLWAATYDFKPSEPKIVFWKDPEKKGSEALDRPMVKIREKAPLPDALWKRLIARYMEPGTGKTYQQLGPLDYLGPKTAKFEWDNKKRKVYGPEVRLSYHFDKLFEALNNGNKTFLEKIRPSLQKIGPVK
jgi:hypothetical protein